MRNYVLDGVRGWAALAVVLFHFVEEPLKGLTPLVTDSWAFFLLDGTFYVCVFFVVSGQALTASFMRTGDISSIDSLLVKRYVRLTVPIVLSCLVVYAILALGLDFHTEATQVLQNQAWMGRFMAQLNDEFPSVMKYALIDVYTRHTASTSPNPFLWTMSVEMVGSLLIFCLCYVWARLKYPFSTLLAVTTLLLALGTFYCLFFAGAAISAIQARPGEKIFTTARNDLLRLLSFAVPIASLGLLHALRDITVPVALYCLLAILSIISIQHNPAYRRAMNHSFSQYLGKISFPIYVVHFAILISPASFFWSKYAFSSVIDNQVYAHILTGLLGALACIPVASLFLKVEKSVTPKIEATLLSLTLVRTTKKHAKPIDGMIKSSKHTP